MFKVCEVTVVPSCHRVILILIVIVIVIGIVIVIVRLRSVVTCCRVVVFAVISSYRRAVGATVVSLLLFHRHFYNVCSQCTLW